jgi:DNA polymerase-3 subunit gamma/tau
LRLRDATSKKILLEVAILKAIEARNALNLDTVLKQLNQLRGEGGGGGAPAASSSVSAASTAATAAAAKPAIQSATAAPTKPVAEPTIAAPPVKAEPAMTLSDAPTTSADLETLWAALVNAVGRVSPFTRTYLVDAHPVSLVKGVLTIGFDPEFEDHVGLVDNARNHTLLQTKLAELGHPNAMIKFIKAEAPVGRVAMPLEAPATTPAARTRAPQADAKAAAPAAKTSAVAFNKDDFKNDPLIQKALEIFKGQIVEVRA